MSFTVRLARLVSFSCLGLSGLLFLLLSQAPPSVERPAAAPSRGPVQLTQRVFTDFSNIRQEKLENFELCPRWYELVSDYKSCLLRQTEAATTPETKLWREIHDWVDRCGGRLIREILNARFLVNRDDIKVVVMPESAGADVVAVTAGIGNDTSAEERLKLILPQTRFFGADPIEEDGRPFAKLGEYRQVAINDVKGSFNASVLRGKKYKWETVDAVPLEQFIRDDLQLPLVDFLFLDVEGAEYRILPALSKKWPRDIPICQVNLELHGPVANYSISYPTFNRLVKSLVKDSSLVPIWIPRPLSHHRFFLIDWKSPKCIQKFFKKWC